MGLATASSYYSNSTTVGNNNDQDSTRTRTRKVFLFSNYALLAAAASCIFLTLSLRLIPSLCGFLLICLHLLTILGALAGLAAASQGSHKWYGAHMAATVLTAIFQGSISVLIFTRADEFLYKLNSYVREDDGVMILKLAGGLCAVIFCFEWVVLTLAFFLKYYSYVEATTTSSKVQADETTPNWPPFKVQV